MKLAAFFWFISLVASLALQPGPSLDARETPLSYDGYHVYSITPSSPQEARDLEKQFKRHYTYALRSTLSVVIPLNEVAAFESLGLSSRLVNADLGKFIRDTDKPSTYNHALQKRGDLPDLSWFDTYHDYADHLQYWDDLVQAFPNNSKKFEIGKSFENRTINAFHLKGKERKDGDEKPVILWHATVHAREWISTMVIEYLAYQLIYGYKSGDVNVTSFLDYYDFYLVPFHNPDGFVYTQTTNRLWRKNRQPRPSINTTCIGTDGNRNWKFQWDASPPDGGSSPDPCSETYRGLAPGDTPENQAMDSLSAKLSKRGPGIRSFIDFHSYGQLILTPYGYTCDTKPDTFQRMLEVAGGVTGAIEAASERGSNYTYGLGCEILYYSTGSSRDHHYGVYGANHSWTLELSPQEASEGGFVLPPEYIWPVVREQWAGQLWLLNNVWND